MCSGDRGVSKVKYIPYDQIKVGQSAQMEVQLSSEEVNTFSALIGDQDSFHISEEAAARTVFRHRICHGVHLLAFVSVLIGQKLPGFGTIYCSHNFEFHNPVYVGQGIQVTVQVMEKMPHHRLRLKTVILREDDVPVLTGEAVIKTYR